MNPLGVCTYSYGIHWKAARLGDAHVPFRNPVEFFDYCHELGARGVQISLGPEAQHNAPEIRNRVEKYQMFFEGQVLLPKESSDVDGFDSSIRAAKGAGATIVRTAALSGRRYEVFDSAEGFRLFKSRAWRSLTLALPILKRQSVKLAIENHKDWRVDEFVDILRRLDSEYVGICVDTGNSIALLEDPMAVIEAYAPYALTAHLKDMAVQEYEAGFLLSEVPLGEGFLDIKRIVEILRKANPRIQFNLEMITRDPLKIPCLTPKYWGAMESVVASDLAQTLGMVKQHRFKESLPHTTGLEPVKQLALEDDQVRRSFEYASRNLEQ